MKIKYVQLESDAFLTDLDFIRMTSAERGLYCSLIFFLNSNNGKCEFDPATLSKLCNCRNEKEFEILWQKIEKKFRIRNGTLKHKRVTKELNRVKKFRQACKQAGLRGANKRWHGHGDPNSEAMTKERKGNVIEKEREDNTSNTNTNNSLSSSSNSARTRLSADVQIQALHFSEALGGIIPPRSQSDRTCFVNVTRWLAEGCASGRFTPAIYSRVLDYAKEAKAGRNPPAVFMALLKKELGYRNV